ncbi:MAG: phage BR0599 family protein, partial [Pseudomonadota bacterium]
MSRLCDLRSDAISKVKFFNHLNFRGFPHMPGD